MQQLIDQINRYYRRQGKSPVFQLSENSRFIIISQAPGKKVHETGIPWNDLSGKKLRLWLGVTDEEFYNKELFSIMPMDFCYPGKGLHGDLPPDEECARKWHPKILRLMKNHPLKILIGSYAIKHYLKENQNENLVQVVKSFKNFLPEFFPMPHPSPRNKNWLKINSWFEAKNIPYLQKYIRAEIQKVTK